MRALTIGLGLTAAAVISVGTVTPAQSAVSAPSAPTVAQAKGKIKIKARLHRTGKKKKVVHASTHYTIPRKSRARKVCVMLVTIDGKSHVIDYYKKCGRAYPNSVGGISTRSVVCNKGDRWSASAWVVNKKGKQLARHTTGTARKLC